MSPLSLKGTQGDFHSRIYKSLKVFTMSILVKSRLKTFVGGIHPEDAGKLLTKGKREVSAPLPKAVYLFMSQHIGAPCKPIVKEGDMVKKGQLVGEAQGFVSANVQASISGRVVNVAPRPHTI